MHSKRPRLQLKMQKPSWAQSSEASSASETTWGATKWPRTSSPARPPSSASSQGAPPSRRMPPGSTSTPSHTDEKSVETQRAKGYSKKFLSWLELIVLGSMGFTKPDQLVCGRIRLSAQASIRSDDLRRTPSGRIEWVDDPLGGEHRDGTSKLLWPYGSPPLTSFTPAPHPRKP